MKIILFTTAGDTILADTTIVEDAERILREYQEKGCSVLLPDGGVVTGLEMPLPDEVFILWPMAGGATLLRNTGGEKIIGIDLIPGRRKVKNLMRRRVVTHEREDAIDVAVCLSLAAAALVAVLFVVL